MKDKQVQTGHEARCTGQRMRQQNGVTRRMKYDMRELRGKGAMGTPHDLSPDTSDELRGGEGAGVTRWSIGRDSCRDQEGELTEGVTP